MFEDMIENEIEYQIAYMILETLLEKGVLTHQEVQKVSRNFIKKYKPFIEELASEEIWEKEESN